MKHKIYTNIYKKGLNKNQVNVYATNEYKNERNAIFLTCR